MTDLAARDELEYKLKNEISASKSQAEKAEAAALLLQEQLATLEKSLPKKRLPGPALKLVDMFDDGKSSAPLASQKLQWAYGGSYLCHSVAEMARLDKVAAAQAEERARLWKLKKDCGSCEKE